MKEKKTHLWPKQADTSSAVWAHFHCGGHFGGGGDCFGGGHHSVA